MSIFRSVLLIVVLLPAVPAVADEIRVAVASNFAKPIQTIARRFEARTGHRVVLITGSTGKHYAQIRNGARIDVFLAADAERPQRLEREGLAVPGSRRTYALGQLVLWSPDPTLVDADGRVLDRMSFRHIAIANPKLAPYGRAAEQWLRSRGLWEPLRDRLVQGENVGQTFQFVRTGAAELGLVAYSQIHQPGRDPSGSWWRPPAARYDPIAQQAVLLNDTRAARDFLNFFREPMVRKIIQNSGYGLP